MSPKSFNVIKVSLFILGIFAICVYVLYAEWENTNSWMLNTDVISSPNTNIGNQRVRFRNHGNEIFQVIVLTQRRHWSLKRLLDSIEKANYHNESVNLIIRIDFDQSNDHAKTIKVANDFVFTHGTKRLVVSNKKQGLIYAWFRAWFPASDTERAVILEDDMELSPLWYVWIQKAWLEFGNITELAGISLSRQRLNATSGQAIAVQNDLPFLYRMYSTFGFSPNARYWRGFVEWARRIDLKKTDVRVEGVITSNWWSSGIKMWSQYFIWWCASGPQLYTVYVHSKNGALVAHWQEKGEHSDRKVGAPSEKLLTKMEPLLETFPKSLQHYGWNFRPEQYNATDNL